MGQPDELYSTLIKTHILLNEGGNLLLQQYDLSNTRYYTLVHLHDSPGLSQKELSERLLCTKSNTSRIVKSLEGAGYVTRQVDPDDNRALCLRLTPAGEDLMQRAKRGYSELNALRFSCLSVSDQDTLQKHLEALNEHLKAVVREQRS